MSKNDVAKRIQRLLDERGEKLKTVTAAIDLNYYSVYPWWQRENSKPDYEKVMVFAKYFSVPVGHLMYGDPIEGHADGLDDLVMRIRSLKDDPRKDLETFLDFLDQKYGSSP